MHLRNLVASLVFAVASFGASAQSKAADIVDTAVQAGNFNTLVELVQAAGLVDTLKGQGPFTVFAPTDEAFQGIEMETMEMLKQPENRAQLQRILTYHVVPGQVMANDLLGNQQFIKTVEGSNVYVQGVAGTVMLGNAVFADTSKYAQVTTADVTADNGVIHVIDEVLMPPQ